VKPNFLVHLGIFGGVTLLLAMTFFGIELLPAWMLQYITEAELVYQGF